MSQSRKKKNVSFNMWTTQSQDLHAGLKGIRVSEKKLTTLSTSTTKITYNGDRKEHALKFGSNSTSPLFGRPKRF